MNGLLCVNSIDKFFFYSQKNFDEFIIKQLNVFMRCGQQNFMNAVVFIEIEFYFSD